MPDFKRACAPAHLTHDEGGATVARGCLASRGTPFQPACVAVNLFGGHAPPDLGVGVGGCARLPVLACDVMLEGGWLLPQPVAQRRRVSSRTPAVLDAPHARGRDRIPCVPARPRNAHLLCRRGSVLCGPAGGARYAWWGWQRPRVDQLPQPHGWLLALSGAVDCRRSNNQAPPPGPQPTFLGRAQPLGRSARRD